MQTAAIESLIRDRRTLVGDIGGTHARFAVVGAGAPEFRRVYLRADFPNAHLAIAAYLSEIRPGVARNQCIRESS